MTPNPDPFLLLGRKKESSEKMPQCWPCLTLKTTLIFVNFCTFVHPRLHRSQSVPFSIPKHDSQIRLLCFAACRSGLTTTPPPAPTFLPHFRTAVLDRGEGCYHYRSSENIRSSQAIRLWECSVGKGTEGYKS